MQDIIANRPPSFSGVRKENGFVTMEIRTIESIMDFWQNCFQSACSSAEVPDIRGDEEYLAKKPSLEVQFGVLRPLAEQIGRAHV